ncbi:hypothetical protein ACWDGI_12120 [Streptomyces sp. NPDC001220]
MNPSRRTVLVAATEAAPARSLPAAATEPAARFEVRAAGELYTSSDPVTVTHTW